MSTSKLMRPQDEFELWCQISNRLNEIKNRILEKESQIPSFNQVQAKRYEEYENDMQHALPYMAPGEIPDLQSYKLTEEEYVKSLKEFFPYYEDLQNFIRSDEFAKLFDIIKLMNQTLNENYPDNYLELQLHNHLHGKNHDRKSTEDSLRKTISDILQMSDKPAIERRTLIVEEIGNCYFAVRRSPGGSAGFFRKGSLFAQLLEEFLNYQVLENKNKVPHVVKPGEETPTITSLFIQAKTNLQRRP